MLIKKRKRHYNGNLMRMENIYLFPIHKFCNQLHFSKSSKSMMFEGVHMSWILLALEIEI